MTEKAFQDYYSEHVSHCYGCGRLNEHGLQIKSYWDGDETVCRFDPKPFHTAIPGYVYGGLIASVIDCHSTGTAAAAACREEGKKPGEDMDMRFVTGSLHVDFLRPTPIDAPMELRAKILEIKPKKVVVQVDLSSKGEICAKGRVVAVRMPPNMAPGKD